MDCCTFWYALHGVEFLSYKILGDISKVDICPPRVEMMQLFLVYIFRTEAKSETAAHFCAKEIRSFISVSNDHLF